MLIARILMFNTLFFLCVGYALVRGQWPERAAAVIFCFARLSTDIVLVSVGIYYHGPEYGVLIIDSLTFLGLTAIALAADRYWPLLMVAFQGASLLAHLARLITFDIMPHIYLNAVQFWAYPQLLLLLVGTVRVDLRLKQRWLGSWPFLQKNN